MPNPSSVAARTSGDASPCERKLEVGIGSCSCSAAVGILVIRFSVAFFAIWHDGCYFKSNSTYFRLTSMKNKSPSGASVGGLVYSTELGRICPACRQAVTQCVCKQSKAPPAGDGVVRVSRETKGRGGKAVTLVKGVALATDELVALAKQLKAASGSGGTVKDGVIEVQGDHCEKLVELLKGKGFNAKRAGG